jgi:hypothetical protein
MHTIRLAAPWETAATAGGMRHARKFGRPRTLDAGERLWLVCAQVPGAAAVFLNGERVATLAVPGPLAVEITPFVQVRNEVAFEVASAEPLGAVALEVRPAS